jgi:hypothetical protein
MFPLRRPHLSRSLIKKTGTSTARSEAFAEAARRRKSSIGHRRLRPESAFTFPEQTARFQRESHEPVQNLLNRMKGVILKRFQLS